MGPLPQKSPGASSTTSSACKLTTSTWYRLVAGRTCASSTVTLYCVFCRGVTVRGLLAETPLGHASRASIRELAVWLWLCMVEAIRISCLCKVVRLELFFEKPFAFFFFEYGYIIICGFLEVTSIPTVSRREVKEPVLPFIEPNIIY